MQQPVPMMGQKKRSKFNIALHRFADRLEDLLARHAFTGLAILFGALVFLSFLDPVLSYFGLDSIAKPLFNWMRIFCAQTPSHSFYIFGHQTCLCERCTAIYTSMFLASCLFLLTRKRLAGIRWWGFALLSIPMALDGFTQMFGLRESNWELRLLTGALFGLGAILFTFPAMQRSITSDRNSAYYQAQRASR
jgi:uncharacterized membrane protein